MAEEKRILIAEDEKPMAKALQMKLNNSGYTAEVAHNGEEALRMIREGGWSLVLLDLIMPKLDGFGVLKQLKEDNIALPPILVSSNLSQAEDFQKARDLGATGYYVKSNTSLAAILELIAKHIQ